MYLSVAKFLLIIHLATSLRPPIEALNFDGYNEDSQADYSSNYTNNVYYDDDYEEEETDYNDAIEGVWVQISTDSCWGKCGNKGGLCEDVCGSNGYCCRKGYDDCPSEAGGVSPSGHSCVRETAFDAKIKRDN